MNIGKIVLMMLSLTFAVFAEAQKIDSVKKDSVHLIKEYHFTGTVSATNNGISFVPTFTLGKPAAIVNLSVGSNRLSFEPEFRASLEGKPWSFIFWGRYKIVQNKHFKLHVGAHPAVAFNTIKVTENGKTKEVIQGQRFLAAEIAPNYFINKNTSVGVYYIVAHGVEIGAVQYTHFLTLNAGFSNIHLSKDFVLRIAPQVYYLKMDKKDGFYTSSTLTLSNKKYPFSLSYLMNKEIKSNIVTKQFNSNLTLSYAFGNTFYKKG